MKLAETSQVSITGPVPDIIAEKTAEQIGAALHVSVLVLFKTPPIYR
jgi:hypothetical protein